MLSRLAPRLARLRTPLTRSFHATPTSLDFISDYNEHVAERLTVGPGIAPKPLDAGQVDELLKEIKAGQGPTEGELMLRLWWTLCI